MWIPINYLSLYVDNQIFSLLNVICELIYFILQLLHLFHLDVLYFFTFDYHVLYYFLYLSINVFNLLIILIYICLYIWYCSIQNSNKLYIIFINCIPFHFISKLFNLFYFHLTNYNPFSQFLKIFLKHFNIIFYIWLNNFSFKFFFYIKKCSVILKILI